MDDRRDETIVIAQASAGRRMAITRSKLGRLVRLMRRTVGSTTAYWPRPASGFVNYSRNYFSSGNSVGGSEPLFHLLVAHQAGLLQDQTATGKDSEIGYSANIEASRKFRVLFGIDF